MRYEKGRKDLSRRRIMEAAARRFRRDGIAASGLAAIMGDVGLTNGAFYSHFKSKADLVRASVADALEKQALQFQIWLDEGGPEAAIAGYLSPEHRDSPGIGCASAALLPEIAREPAETRQLYSEHFLVLVRELAEALPPDIEDREEVALGVLSTAIGAIQLARAVDKEELSDRILALGAESARALITQQDRPTKRTSKRVS